MLERRDPVAWVTFDRPQARNSFTHAMYARLAAICEELASDDAVRIVVLQGRGDEAFVAGSDISQFVDFRTGEQARAYEGHVERAIGGVERLPKPTIALLRGAATGAGAALAIVCDLRVAAPNLRLGVPIAQTLGNTLSMRNVARLVEAVGPAVAKDVLLTARLIGADEALRRGIVHEVVPLERIEARVAELAAHVASLAPLTLRAAKLAILRALEAGRAAMGDGEDLVAMAYTSEDFQEGVRAFLEKRQPRWRGR